MRQTSSTTLQSSTTLVDGKRRHLRHSRDEEDDRVEDVWREVCVGVAARDARATDAPVAPDDLTLACARRRGKPLVLGERAVCRVGAAHPRLHKVRAGQAHSLQQHVHVDCELTEDVYDHVGATYGWRGAAGREGREGFGVGHEEEEHLVRV
jgi:hypothetical protein